jgi:hypothetical protein
MSLVTPPALLRIEGNPASALKDDPTPGQVGLGPALQGLCKKTA